VVADIGIPAQLERPTAAALATRSLLDLVPRKDAGSSKYGAGSVLVVGGSAGFDGPPLLCALAALRARPGIAWAAVAEAVAAASAVQVPEVLVSARPGRLEVGERAGAHAHAREEQDAKPRLKLQMIGHETLCVGYGRRTYWHAARLMQFPRGEAAHRFCDIHSLMDSAATTLQPGDTPGLPVPANRTQLGAPGPMLTPPGRLRRSVTVGRGNSKLLYNFYLELACRGSPFSRKR